MVDKKKEWFYNVNQPFFWFEKSGWPQKKIQVCRTTFLETLFYTFLEKWLQNKWSSVSIHSKLLNKINMPFLWKLQDLTLSVTGFPAICDCFLTSKWGKSWLLDFLFLYAVLNCFSLYWLQHTGSSCLMQISLLRISLLRFFRTITKIWLMRFYGLFILLLHT